MTGIGQDQILDGAKDKEAEEVMTMTGKVKEHAEVLVHETIMNMMATEGILVLEEAVVVKTFETLAQAGETKEVFARVQQGNGEEQPMIMTIGRMNEDREDIMRI
jgi:hypothetical protein